MISSFSFLSFAFAALSLQTASATAGAIAGSYAATGEAGSCRVMLMSPAMRPPESDLAVNAVSGLAAVAPDCPLALRDAGLWTLREDEGQLILTSHGGERLWSGMPAPDGNWQGPDASGMNVRLARR